MPDIQNVEVQSESEDASNWESFEFKRNEKSKKV